jgi:hypothetical protein
MSTSTLIDPLVNKYGTTYSNGLFTDTSIPSHGLPAAYSNIDGANSYIPGYTSKGGKSLRKNKNIRKYYMNKSRKSTSYKSGKSSRKYMKSRKLRKNKKLAHHSKRSHKSIRRVKKMRGGTYQQYQSDQDLYTNYSIGQNLPPELSALANPGPVNVVRTS